MKVIRITKPKQRRGAAKDPFYNSKDWTRFRKFYLQENPLCVMCLKEGVTRDATVVDHIKQRSLGGADFDKKNMQSLCDRHHNIKRAEESKRSKAI